MQNWNSALQKAPHGRLGTLLGSTDYRLEKHVSTAMNVYYEIINANYWPGLWSLSLSIQQNTVDRALRLEQHPNSTVTHISLTCGYRLYSYEYGVNSVIHCVLSTTSAIGHRKQKATHIRIGNNQTHKCMINVFYLHQCEGLPRVAIVTNCDGSNRERN